MITSAVLHWFAGVVAGLAGLWPAYSLPSWLTQPATPLSAIFANASSIGVWLNWPVLVAVVGAVIAAYGVNLVTRGLRWILGLFPTMGGGS